MHSTAEAIRSAKAIGLILGRNDFSRIALAITDALANDGMRLSPLYKARLVDSGRNERWHIEMGNVRSFDILYEPLMAMVTRVLNPTKTVPTTPSDQPLSLAARLSPMLGGKARVRMVLAALYEPDSAMLAVGNEKMWKRMVDAALAECE